MQEDKNAIEKEIAELEQKMAGADFWSDKAQAQGVIKKIAELKEKLAGAGKYDKGDAVITIFSGAGGDDAEDFSAMLYRMYEKYAAKRGFGLSVVHKNENDHGGYRNISFLVEGKGLPAPAGASYTGGQAGAYGILKNESGVHRLVRLSPFNSKKLRHTSFSMVEVIPKFAKADAEDVPMPETDLKIEFSRAGGPGGQNVNKRETAVRIVHIPTNLAVHVNAERSQEQNRELAMQLLRAKLYKRLEEERVAKEKGMYISKTTEIEWGNQIRSYVLHPYKMVKDHRTGIETSNIDAVLEGEIDEFLEAEKTL